MFVFSFN